MVKGAMETTREAADAVEGMLPKELKPYPSYEELLYSHHSDAETHQFLP